MVQCGRRVRTARAVGLWCPCRSGCVWCRGGRMGFGGGQYTCSTLHFRIPLAPSFWVMQSQYPRHEGLSDARLFWSQTCDAMHCTSGAAQTCTIRPSMAHTYRHIKRQNDCRPEQSQKSHCSVRSSLGQGGSCRQLSHHPIAPSDSTPTSTKSHLWHKHSVSIALCRARPQPINPAAPQYACLRDSKIRRRTTSKQIHAVVALVDPHFRCHSTNQTCHLINGTGSGGGSSTTNRTSKQRALARPEADSQPIPTNKWGSGTNGPQEKLALPRHTTAYCSMPGHEPRCSWGVINFHQVTKATETKPQPFQTHP